jgi:hypothetical protein
MQCLKDYIGVKCCGFAPSDSGIYINDLPGVEFANIDGIADADQVSWAGVWADVQSRAIRRFRVDLIGAISGFDRRYRIKQISQTADLGRVIDVSQISPASSVRLGHTLELNNLGDQCVCSNLQNIYAQSTSVWMQNPGLFTLNFTDIDLDIVLYTTTVTGVAGWNLVKVEQEFSATRISVTVDSTLLNRPMLDLSQFGLSDVGVSGQTFCSNCSGGFGFDSGTSSLWFDWGCGCVAKAQGYSVNAGVETYGYNTYGISTVWSVRCTYNNVVCNNKIHFAQAFLYCLAAELMTERIYSSRINRWTTVDLKKAYELRTEFEVEYRGGQRKDGSLIEGYLKTCVNGVSLNMSDCCIECDQMIMFAEPIF